MKSAQILIVAAAMLSPLPAQAVTLDLYTMNCTQFLEADKDTISMMLTWLDGWYKGDSDEALIDTDVFVENARRIGAYCRSNPTVSIVTAADAILGK